MSAQSEICEAMVASVASGLAAPQTPPTFGEARYGPIAPERDRPAGWWAAEPGGGPAPWQVAPAGVQADGLNKGIERDRLMATGLIRRRKDRATGRLVPVDWDEARQDHALSGWLTRGCPYRENLLRDVCAWVREFEPRRSHGWVFTGPTDTGKTRLARAMLWEVVLRNAGVNGLYLHLPWTIARIKGSWNDTSREYETEADVLGQIADADLVVFDELTTPAADQRARQFHKEMLFNFASAAVENKTCVIATSNENRNDFDEWVQDVTISRRIWGQAHRDGKAHGVREFRSSWAWSSAG